MPMHEYFAILAEEFYAEVHLLRFSGINQTGKLFVVSKIK
jgi:hypothetical protein